MPILYENNPSLHEYGGKETTFLARRHIYNHRESKDFHRVFLTIEDSRSNVIPYVYIQFYFDREEHRDFCQFTAWE